MALTRVGKHMQSGDVTNGLLELLTTQNKLIIEQNKHNLQLQEAILEQLKYQSNKMHTNSTS